MAPLTRSTTGPSASSSEPASTSLPIHSSSMEQLPKYISHLNPTSTNWAIFRLHFKQAMIACHRWPYLEGMKVCPVLKDKEKPTEEEATKLEAWDHNDFMAHFLLLQ